MLLSIVVPFYQVEPYFPACLSALGQLSGEEAEVIFVDDCGSDGCLAMAEAFCQEHPHARILRRSRNGGLSAARNTGLSQAKGTYVYFLDSDDVPLPGALLAAAREAMADRLDLIRGTYQEFEDGSLRETNHPVNPCGVGNGREIFLHQHRLGEYEPMVWQGIYRRAFLQECGLQMPEGLLFEDEVFSASACFLAERAAVVSRTLVRYRQRPGSIMESFGGSTRWCDCYLSVCRTLGEIARRESGPAGEALTDRTARIAVSVVKNIPYYALSPADRREVLQYVRRNREELSQMVLCSHEPEVRLQGRMLRYAPDVLAGVCAVVYRMRNAFSSK